MWCPPGPPAPDQVQCTPQWRKTDSRPNLVWTCGGPALPSHPSVCVCAGTGDLKAQHRAQRFGFALFFIIFFIISNSFGSLWTIVWKMETCCFWPTWMSVSVAPLIQWCTSLSVSNGHTEECGDSSQHQEGLGEAEASSLEHHHLDRRERLRPTLCSLLLLFSQWSFAPTETMSEFCVQNVAGWAPNSRMCYGHSSTPFLSLFLSVSLFFSSFLFARSLFLLSRQPEKAEKNAWHRNIMENPAVGAAEHNYIHFKNLCIANTFILLKQYI